jgi:hypothetical protein
MLIEFFSSSNKSLPVQPINPNASIITCSRWSQPDIPFIFTIRFSQWTRKGNYCFRLTTNGVFSYTHAPYRQKTPQLFSAQTS